MSSNPRNFVPLDDAVLFSGFSPAGAPDGLWRTGAGDGETHYVVDLPGTTFDYKSDGSQAYFWLNPYTSSQSRERAWRTDGSQAGTFLVKEFNKPASGLNPGTNEYAAGPTALINGTLYFQGRRETKVGLPPLIYTMETGYELGAYSVAGGYQLRELATDFISSFPINFLELNGAIYFTTSGGVADGLWKTTGTAAPQLVINPGTTFRDGALTYGQNMVFAGNDGKLWKSNGTAAGTIAFATLPAAPDCMAICNGKIVAAVPTTTLGTYEIWLTDFDLTEAQWATTLVGSPTATINRLINFGQRLFFVWDDPLFGSELWATDGTAEGTALFLDINPGIAGSVTSMATTSPAAPAAVDFRLYFVANDGVHGAELWVTDGTPAGTELVVDAYPGPTSGNPTYLTSIRGSLYLSVYGAGVGIEPHVITAETYRGQRSDVIGRQRSGWIYVGVSQGSHFDVSDWDHWASMVPWTDMRTGDFNGDGLTDMVARDSATARWYVSLSRGSWFNTNPWTTWSSAATWVDLQVGDFNGDGRDDIACRYKEGGEWYVGLSNGHGFDTEFWGRWSWNNDWLDVMTGDFNADGMADIAGRNAFDGQWFVGLAKRNLPSSGSSNQVSFESNAWGTWSPSIAWADVGPGDLDGDGRTDIIGRFNAAGHWWAAMSSGSSFSNEYWGHWTADITWADVRIGDFNGDRKADVVGRWQETGQWWVGESIGYAFQNRYFGQWTDYLNWVDVRIGDFDGDGRSDITGRWLEASEWYVGRSNGSAFENKAWGGWPTTDVWADILVGNPSRSY